MLRQSIYGALCVALLFVLGVARAVADVVPVLPGDFSGHETIADFSG
jgi:hypothetical protein